MIMPARWYAGGRGLDSFRDTMLNDTNIIKIADFPDSRDIFPTVLIKGGISFFLWGKNDKDTCLIENWNKGILLSSSYRFLKEKDIDIFIRYNAAISILKKVRSVKHKPFSLLVSNMKPFGLRTYFNDYVSDPFSGSVRIYANGGDGYINPHIILQGCNVLNKYKIFISRAYGAGEEFPHQILNKPILGGQNSCCTETYLYIGPFNCETEQNNAYKYIRSLFFRFMVMLKKNTQDAPSRVYELVPMQDFTETSDIDWSKSIDEIDAQLYKKYRLTAEEINFIESMIKPMG